MPGVPGGLVWQRFSPVDACVLGPVLGGYVCVFPALDFVQSALFYILFLSFCRFFLLFICRLFLSVGLDQRDSELVCFGQLLPQRRIVSDCMCVGQRVCEYHQPDCMPQRAVLLDDWSDFLVGGLRAGLLLRGGLGGHCARPRYFEFRFLRLAPVAAANFVSFSACRNRTVFVSTLAGSGAAGSSNDIGAQASINFPAGVAINRAGNFAVATERVGHRVRMIDLVTSQVSTLAGSGTDAFADGQGTEASFSAPEGVAVSPDGASVVVVEGALTSSHRVRHIAIATGVVTTLAGNGSGFADGVGTMAKFNVPRGVAFSPDGTYILIADSWNFRVRRLDVTTRAVTTIAGSSYGSADGTGTNAKFGSLFQLAIDPTGSYALICDPYNYHKIRRLDIATAQVTTLAGSGAAGSQDGAGTSAIFNTPLGVSIDPTGTYALIVDDAHRIRRIVIATAQVTTLAGTGIASAVNGVGVQASFWSPHAISIDTRGTFALVADAANNRIRRITLSSPCAVGFYCPSGSSSPTQASCGAGTFCAAVTGLSAPTLCAPGYFCAGSSAFTVRGAVNGQGICISWFFILVIHIQWLIFYCGFIINTQCW